jgi:hypothetical protein
LSISLFYDNLLNKGVVLINLYKIISVSFSPVDKIASYITARTQTTSNLIDEVEHLDSKFITLILNGDQFIQEWPLQKMEEISEFLNEFSKIIEKIPKKNELLEGDQKAFNLASNLAEFVLGFLDAYCGTKFFFKSELLALRQISGDSLKKEVSVFKVNKIYDDASEFIDEGNKLKDALIGSQVKETLEAIDKNNISSNISKVIEAQCEKLEGRLLDCAEPINSAKYSYVLPDNRPYDINLGFFYIRYTERNH